MTRFKARKRLLSLIGSFCLFILPTYAGSSATPVPLSGFDAEQIEGMPLDDLYVLFREFGFKPSWTYVPDRQTASFSKDFWCRKTWIVSWRVKLTEKTPIATDVKVAFINACD